MIGGVTVARAAAVMTGISGFARRETPQSMRGQKFARANIDDGFLLLGSEQADRQGHGKNLIRPQRGVTSGSWRIDDVETTIAVRVPKSLERFFRLGCESFVNIAWFR